MELEASEDKREAEESFTDSVRVRVLSLVVELY